MLEACIGSDTTEQVTILIAVRLYILDLKVIFQIGEWTTPFVCRQKYRLIPMFHGHKNRLEVDRVNLENLVAWVSDACCSCSSVLTTPY